MADDRPRASLRPAVAWVAAAVAAVAVASWGVALVGRSVTDERPSPLSASQVEQRLQDLATTTTRAAVTTTETSTTTTEPVSDPATTTTIAAPPTTTAPPTTAPPPPSTTATGETRTYSMVGGTASLRFAPTGVTVVFANPAPGFDVEVEPEHGGVKVEFESEDHRSRLEGWWEDGPQDRVEEGDHDD